MLRREFMLAGAALALSPVIASAQRGMRARITDVRPARIRLVRELGTLDNTNFIPNMRPSYRVGGNGITQIVSDQGVIGIGPGISADAIAQFREILVGRDPLDVRQIIPVMGRRGGREAASVEIALWDLVGKLTGQPLYKLWGGAKDRNTPYSSFMTTGTPEERGRLAARVKAQGFKACKLRTSFPTMAEDIRVVEAVRRACGPDFMILTDANKAYGNLHMWDMRRANDTARAYQELGVFWLEEPLPQFHLDQLAELNSRFDLPIAGAEGTDNEFEFREQIRRRAYDYLNCEIARIGPSMALRIQTIAEPQGIAVVPHQGDGFLATICQHHLVGAWPNAPVAELIHEPPIADFVPRWSVFTNPPTLDPDGTMLLPQEPGLGVTINPELLIEQGA